MKIVYVAGKYRAENPWEVECNIHRAKVVGVAVGRLGAMPLIPHANTAHFDGTQADEFWLDGTLELCRRCDALVTVEGWEKSGGARKEVQTMLDLCKPVFYTVEALGRWLESER